MSLKSIKKRGKRSWIKSHREKVKNVTIRLCCCIRHRVIKQATRIDLIVAFGVSKVRLSPALFLSIQGNWPLIGEIGSLLWEAVAYYQNALLTYLNTSNQILFKVLLFNYLCLCFMLECYCSILLSFRNFVLFKFKKLQITIQTQITKHKVEKSIFNDVCSIVFTYIIAKLALCNGLKIYFSETLCNHLHTSRSCLKTNFFPT